MEELIIHSGEIIKLDPMTIVRFINEYPYRGVADIQIQNYIDADDFIDTSNGLHLNGTSEHQAHRIASLVNLIKREIQPDIITLLIDRYRTKTVCSLEDGNHRLRAYLFLNKLIPVRISYDSWI